MFAWIDKAVFLMALIRILSGCIEVGAALLFIKFNDIQKAMIINSSLAFIGPMILILTTSIGLIGLANQISWSKMFWIVLGVGFILYGVKQ